MRFRTVRCALALEVVLLHHALEPLALRPPDDIHPITRLKLRHVQIDVSLRRVSLEAKLPHQFLRLGTGLLEFAEPRLRHARFLLRAETDFDRGVTVVLRRDPAQKHVIAGCDHGHWTHPTIRVVNAGHADFLS